MQPRCAFVEVFGARATATDIRQIASTPSAVWMLGHDGGLARVSMRAGRVNVTTVDAPAPDVVQLECGVAGCCVRTQSGALLLCFDEVDSARTWRRVSLESVSDVTVGERHVCAIARGEAYCWGEPSLGRLGTGAGLPAYRPRPVEGLPRIRQAVALAENTCALDDAGRVWCWGLTAYGVTGERVTAARIEQLSDLAVSSWRPVQVAVAAARELVAGRHFLCARSADADAGPARVPQAAERWFCWGYLPRFDRLGDYSWRATLFEPERRYSGEFVSTPRAVDRDGVRRLIEQEKRIFLEDSGPRGSWWERKPRTAVFAECASQLVVGRDALVGVTTGDRHVCAWSAHGALVCCGDNAYEQLSERADTTPDVPRRVLAP
jgi:hypothetical protein